MEGNTLHGRDPFLKTVFPTEIIEIAKRKKTVFNAASSKALIHGLPEVNDVIAAQEKLYTAKIQQESNKKFWQPIKSIFRLFQKKEVKIDDYDACQKELEDKQGKLLRKVKPSTKNELVGLALSGGGIRSATFNLGVLQVLSARGALKHVDYLSTVSGGGYIGSCLSSLLNNPETGPGEKEFPFHHEKGKPEPQAFKQLRNYGNYIAPNGIVDWLKMPAFFIRGAIINLLLLLPYILLAVLLTLFFYGGELREIEKDSFYAISEDSLEKLKSEGVHPVLLENLKDKEFTKKEDVSGLISQVSEGKQIAWHTSTILQYIKKYNFTWEWKAFYRWTPCVGIGFLGYCILFILLQVFFEKRLSCRTKYGNTFGIGLVVVFACAIIESAPMVLSYYRIMDIEEFKTIASAVISFTTVIFAGKAAEHISKLRGKLILYLLGAIGPFLVFIIYLIICTTILERYPPAQPFPYKTIIVTAFGVFVFTRVFTNVNIVSFHGFYRDQLSKAYLFQTSEGGNEIQSNDEQPLSRLNREGTKAPYHLLNVALNLHGSSDLNLHGRNADFFILSKRFCGGVRTGFCRTEDMEKADPHVNLGTAMAISGAAAAPNMGTATIKPLVFLMTLLNIRLGYWLPNPVKLLRKKHKVRQCIQYWRFSPFSGVGPMYLLRELLGLISEKDEYINVSDGGHIENLGIYELLRRRCKYIIACDAEEDPDMTFGGLAKLMRYARIDLSIDIDIDLDALRKGEHGFANRHCAFGKIHYGEGETGYLLYIKSSLTGDENEYIREYRSKNKDFPHESTGDQFFNEAQFEAYRALGYHIADTLEGWEVFESGRAKQSDNLRFPAGEKERDDKEKGLDASNQDVFNEWYKILETSLLPPYRMENTFLSMQEQLSTIEKMYLDPDIAEYTYQVFPDLKCTQSNEDAVECETKLVCEPDTVFPIAKTDADKERYRKIFHFCNQQMHLMEGVFIALQLDKPFYRDHHLNQGWMHLFHRWAEAPYFRWAWAVSIGTYSIGFQKFCEEVLGLSRKISWRIGDESELMNYGMDDIKCKGKSLQGLGEIWIADMFVSIGRDKKSIPFPIGYVVVRGAEEKYAEGAAYTVNIMFYFIHKYYRKMGLLEQMITTLPHALRMKYGGKPNVCIHFGNEHEKLRYGSYFKRYGSFVVSSVQ